MKYEWDYAVNLIEPYCNNLKQIYPLMQREVNETVKNLSKIPEVLRITIFGSSVTPIAHQWSDIDLYVDTEEDYEGNLSFLLPLDSRRDFDLWCTKMLKHTQDDSLLDEIRKTGVVVYEKNTTLLCSMEIR
ncbi:MAG: nucleotidyltransferase domain-containing protein [Bacillota bacterium]